jgi:hypothetical protein
MNARGHTMKRQRTHSRIGRALGFAFLLTMGPTIVSCWSSDPCEPGQTVHFDACYPAQPPVGAAGAPSTPADGGVGDAGAVPPPSSFGEKCSAAADCKAGSPICGAPQLPYCTQINCQDGEANAGACPAQGWQCLKVGANPSVCLKS